MEHLSIRPALKSDASSLSEIGYAAWLKGIGSLIPAQSAENVSQKSFEDFALSATDNILVAVLNKDIVGFVATGKPDNYISDLWVSPESEGQGIGSKLVAALETHILDRGYNTAEIEVMSANQRALELYLRLGYRISATFSKPDPALLIDLEKTRLCKDLVDQD
ncbi:MAG: GNAT family N-acetyltransferase [Alphaproteobacteria bacterium]|nr:GNAT family N-acetyltransferase [Alphaproteobacteria bacterium]MBT4086723.1 GNAT family N-acetyltransferase [Alphaproteobacteria bacterium]MBT4545351.1 GNAT family N-acetyltransferase [Alphaproteobacteria bacterium]MBT6387088.1 GNAT family N-acetyltransferase [Alphaproteobacteria bacterium]MBT7744763.1 GNAT family N-acetyltransferase [Alphaproteobacteria bacterium]